MRAVRFVASAAASILPAVALASPITDSILRDRLVGSWAAAGDCSRGGIIFREDGTFSVTGDYADSDFTGTFDVVDGRLAGVAGARTMPVLRVLFDRDGALILGPDLFERCAAPPPGAATPSRP
jgi:hypothetical protein